MLPSRQTELMLEAHSHQSIKYCNNTVSSPIHSMENTLLPWRYVGKEFSHNRIQRMAHFEGQNRPKALKKKGEEKKKNKEHLREIPVHLKLFFFIIISYF